MTAKKIVIRLLGFFICLLIVADLTGILILKKYYFVRFKPVKDLSTYAADSVQNPQQTPDEAIRKLKLIMNKVNKVESDPDGDVTTTKEYVKNGGGLDCSGMAQIYYYALGKKQIPARLIALTRDFGNTIDSHSTVEVNLAGKWVIMDPTFNISFKKNGVLIGAQEIHDSLVDGTFNQIEPVFYGEVAYPGRVEKYYMHWLSLYNNVFIPQDETFPFWAKYTPLRYWYGPAWLYDDGGPGNNQHIKIFDQLYFDFVVILPCLIVVLAVLVIPLVISELISVRKRSRLCQGHLKH